MISNLGRFRCFDISIFSSVSFPSMNCEKCHQINDLRYSLRILAFDKLWIFSRWKYSHSLKKKLISGIRYYIQRHANKHNFHSIRMITIRLKDYDFTLKKSTSFEITLSFVNVTITVMTRPQIFPPFIICK